MIRDRVHKKEQTQYNKNVNNIEHNIANNRTSILSKWQTMGTKGS